VGREAKVKPTQHNEDLIVMAPPLKSGAKCLYASHNNTLEPDLYSMQNILVATFIVSYVNYL